MYSSKHKIPGIAYARSNKNNNRLYNQIDSSSFINGSANTKSQSTSNLIYNSLMAEITEDNSNYIKRLEKECNQKRSQSHLRSQTIKTVGSSPLKQHSPDNEKLISTPTNSIKQYKTITPKVSNYVTTNKNTQRFFSRNFQEHQTNHNSRELQQHDYKHQDQKFVSFLDGYVNSLSRQSQKQQIQSPTTLKKLAIYQYKFKQMEYLHQVQVKKQLKKQKIMKQRIQQMDQQILDLTIRLKHQQQQKRRFQQLFIQYQKELAIMKDKYKDPEISSFTSSNYDFSYNSQLNEDEINLNNFEINKFQKLSLKGHEVDLNTSQKINRFLRKPFNDIRSTKPGISVSDQEEEY